MEHESSPIITIGSAKKHLPKLLAFGRSRDILMELKELIDEPKFPRDEGRRRNVFNVFSGKGCLVLDDCSTRGVKNAKQQKS